MKRYIISILWHMLILLCISSSAGLPLTIIQTIIGTPRKSGNSSDKTSSLCRCDPTPVMSVVSRRRRCQRLYVYIPVAAAAAARPTTCTARSTFQQTAVGCCHSQLPFFASLVLYHHGNTAHNIITIEIGAILIVITVLYHNCVVVYYSYKYVGCCLCYIYSALPRYFFTTMA